MRKHLLYLVYLVRHKWYVFLAACGLGIPWLGLIHDWSKFLPSEWWPYANRFYGCVPEDYPPFDMAWLLHQKRNKHHWQWWILKQDEDVLKVLDMPDRYRREMLADWRGAGRALGKSDTAAWYGANRERQQMHPNARAWIDSELGYINPAEPITRGRPPRMTG